MRKKSLPFAALAAVAGTVLQLGGCLGGGLASAVLANIVADQVGGLLNISDLLGGLSGG